jgi:hypothetical protein
MPPFTLRREHKEQNKRQVLFARTVIIVILLVYWFSRLMNLAMLPVFVDEAIMLRDAQHLSTWPTPPEQLARNSKWLHVWLLHLIFPADSKTALWCGRFLSVVAGSLACLGCYRLGKQISGKPVGLLSAALYVLLPFSLWNDRLAAADSLTGALFLLSWSTALKLVASKNATFLDSLLCGLSLGLASLTKAVGIVALAIPIICLVVYWERRNARRVWKRVVPTYILALLLSSFILVYLPLQVIMIERHTVAGTSLDSMIDQWLQNLKNVTMWLSGYWGYVGLFLLLAGLVCATICRRRRATLLAISVVGPLFILIVISRNWFPRYFTPIAGPSYVLISWVVFRSIEFARKRLLYIPVFQPWRRKAAALLLAPVLLILCWQPISFDRSILTNPPAAPLPAVDLKQYIQGWPAGYGVPETSDFLLRQAKANPGSSIQVIRNYLLDPLFPGLEIYLNATPSVELHVLDLSQADSVGKTLELAKLGPTFVVLNQPRVPSSFDEMYGSYARLVARYPKPGGQSEIQIWQIQ